MKKSIVIFLLIAILENIQCNDVDVLVLGAGLSGVGAAMELHKQGVDNFLVLEAKDYIGGRLREEVWFGKTIAIGAGWIHKIDANHEIYKLAKKYGLQYHQDDYNLNDMAMRSLYTGKRFNRWYVANTQKELKKGLKKCMDHVEQHAEARNMTLRECLEFGGWDIASIKREKMREDVDYFMFDFENAGPPEKMSAWQMSYTGEGVDLVVTDPRGYNYPVSQEIKPFREKFVLNTEVQSVVRKWGGRFYVTTNKGVYRAKHVIVSFSSGVLLANKVRFQPPLPAWKTAALQYVPMGHYCKYFFKFPYQFWEDKVTYIIIGTKPRGHYVHWQNMNQPHFYPGSNILLATLTGEMCKETDSKDDATVIKEAMKIIRHQVDYKNAPDPIAVRRSHWSSDPHVLGAYSFPKPGVTPKHYRALEHPVHQRLWFTGEYANEESFGYTHGALQHGQSIGGKVVKCLKKGVCPGNRPE